MKDSLLLNPNSYVDYDKLPSLIELVEEFSKQDLSNVWSDVGEDHVGTSINWKSVTYDIPTNHFSNDGLAEIMLPIVEYVKTMQGINRVTVNYLFKYSFMPIHVDGEGIPEYDTSNLSYNIIIPVTDHGQSIIDYTVIKNKKGHPLIFDGMVPHGAMNDTLDTRITIFLLVDKTKFTYDCS